VTDINALYAANDMAEDTTIVIYGGIILALLVALVASSVIANVFRMSAAATLSQSGILKSVGATGKQVRVRMRYEALYLALIGVPVGLLLGTLLQAVTIQPIGRSFSALFLAAGLGHYIGGFHFSWAALGIGAALSALLVYISVIIPARKAGKTPAIDAITGNAHSNSGKVKTRKYRAVFLLFGFTGLMAARNISRSRREFRSMTITLSVIVATALGFATISNILATNVDAVVLNASISLYQEPTQKPILAVGSFRALTTQFLSEPNINEAQFLAMGLRKGQFRTVIPSDALSAKIGQQWDISSEDTATVGVTIIEVNPYYYRLLLERSGTQDGSYLLFNRYQEEIPWANPPQEIDLASTELSSLGARHSRITIDGVVHDMALPNYFWGNHSCLC
jgi:putative ABC transport system permease protein